MSFHLNFRKDLALYLSRRSNRSELHVAFERHFKRFPGLAQFRMLINEAFELLPFFRISEPEHIAFNYSARYVFLYVHFKYSLNCIKAFLILVFTVPRGMSSICAISS